MHTKRAGLAILLGLVSIFLTMATPKWANASEACADAAAWIPRRFVGLEQPLSPPKFKSPARIVLSRYGGHSNFHSTSARSWISNGKAFVPEHSHHIERVGYGDHESILAEQQDFSLGKMVETGYLTPQEAEMFRKLGTNLEPGQINFFEMVHEATPEELKQFYKDYPSLRREVTRADPGVHGENASIKTAAMWSVAGQVWDREAGLRPVSLAWEKEEARKGQELDRKKHKYVWEWGRAAQDASGEIASLYSANALLSYIQLRAYGGKLEDAYVMAHSFDETNTRLYLRMHPGSMYPANWKNPNDALFLIPLKDALEKYKPSKVSNHVAQIVELSGRKISELQAVDLLIENRILRWQEFDFNTTKVHQPTPIIINDSTLTQPRLLGLRLMQFQMDHETTQRVLDYFAEVIPVLHSANFEGKYNNASDSLLSSYVLHKDYTVEISNLDPNIALFDPTYVASVLMLSYSKYLDRVAQMLHETYKIPIEEAYFRSVTFLKEYKVQFAVTTSFEPIEKRLKELHPNEVVPMQGTVTEGGGPHPVNLRIHPYMYRDARIYIYSIEQIQSLINNNRDLFRQLGPGMQPGLWQTQYFLSQPDLF